MNRNSIRWRLPASYAAIALLTTFALGLVLYTILRSYYDRQEESYLQSRAFEIGAIASELLQAGLAPEMIQDLSRSWSLFLQARVQLLDAAGHQIADSGMPREQKVFFIASEKPFQIPVGESFTAPAREDRLFQIQVLNNEPVAGISEKHDVIIYNSEAVGVAMSADVSMNGLLAPNAIAPGRRSSQVVTRPVLDPRGNVLGKVILSEGPAYGDEILNNVMNGWILASMAAILIAGLAGWIVSTRIATPLTELTQITSRMSQGDLSARADIHSKDELGTLGHAFNEMAERVQETVGTLRSFVADAAHELHTPLTALQANLELARDEKSPAARTRYLSRAHEQSQRLEALVQSLLDLSRIEAAESRSSFGSVNLSQVVREIGEPFASRAEQADRLFNMSVAEDALHVSGAETQLRQVVINLLENALKFTPQTGSISLDLMRVEDEARLTITDTGIGIPPEDQPHLFERFHRGRNASEYAGNGLGLAIVKAILTRHHGSVAVQSQPGQGTRVNVMLPVSQESDA